MRSAAFVKSSIKINNLHTWIRMGTFWYTLIQFLANLLKNQFPPNIMHTKFYTFTVYPPLNHLISFLWDILIYLTSALETMYVSLKLSTGILKGIARTWAKAWDFKLNGSDVRPLFEKKNKKIRWALKIDFPLNRASLTILSLWFAMQESME